MSEVPLKNVTNWNSRAWIDSTAAMRERFHRKQVVNAVLLVIVLFQLVNLPGALLMNSPMDIGSVLLGLLLCGVAAYFNQLGRITIVALLLIAVVDLGCGLMLLTSPMGLDISDLPVFDVLLVSSLIAVSLMPPASVFIVALSNILFIVGVLLFQPHTMDMNMLLTSNMAYNTLIQPVSLQIVVAIVAYIWVRNALLSIARADRAEEIVRLQNREAELLRRETELSQQLSSGSEHLLDVLVRAANGDYTVRPNLQQNHPLWRIGNALNVLLMRMRRTNSAEQEVKLLRKENDHLSQLVYGVNVEYNQQNPISSPLQRQSGNLQAPGSGVTPPPPYQF